MADDDFEIDIYGDDRPLTAVPDDIELDDDNAQKEQQDPEMLPNAPSQAQAASPAQTPTPNTPSMQVATPAAGQAQEGTPGEGKPPGATALRMNELHWWVTEDDVRSWVNACQLENEIIEIAFAEHKENGKSKGEVWVHLSTPQITANLRRHLTTEQDLSKYFKTQSIAFANGDYNPYRNNTNNPQKQYQNRQGQQSGYNQQYQNNFRGRGGFQQRGAMMNSGRGGYQQQMGGYNNMRGGFQMNNRGRGGMMNMMPGNMMAMGGMMPMMMGNMGGFVNPQFQGASMNGGTPHGVKRPRQDSG